MSELSAHSDRSLDQAGVVCCLVGEEQFALHGSTVRLVTRAERMRPDPGRHNRLGTIRHRDDVAPVYSLAALLGRRARLAAPDSHVVVVQAGGSSFAILVDRAVRSKQVEKKELLPLPRIVGVKARQWFEGILRVGDVSCLLLSPTGLRPDSATTPGETAQVARRGLHDARSAHAPDMVVIFSSAALPGGRARRYALPARQVAAVVQALPALQLPGAPAFVKELAWWQRAAVPILDFSAHTGDAVSRCNRHLLARAREGGWMGFEAEADVVLYRALLEDRLVRDSTLAAQFITGVFALGDERVALLDLDALVASGQPAPLALCAG